MNVFTNTLLATTILSLISLVGVGVLLIRKDFLDRIVFYLVAFAAGTMLGGSFLHLMPEGVALLEPDVFFRIMLLSFIVLFIIEKLIHWHHCHDQECDEHAFGYMNLIGDGIHNFFDGVVIAAAFSVDIHIGFVTTLALALHEIPQEIGDFGVLLYAGFTTKKALLYNLLVSLTSVLGGIAGYFAITTSSNLSVYALPLGAASLLYVSTSDLIPELRDKTEKADLVYSYGLLFLGVLFMYALTFLEV